MTLCFIVRIVYFRNVVSVKLYHFLLSCIYLLGCRTLHLLFNVAFLSNAVFVKLITFIHPVYQL